MHKIMYMMSMVLVGSLMACATAAEWPADKDSKMTLITDRNTAFAMDLYQQIRKSDGNLFYSPFSVSTVLTMVYAGARGETADQLSTTLHVADMGDTVHHEMHKLLAHVNNRQDAGNIILKLANALWPQQDYPLEDAFVETLQTAYGAGVTPLDFRTNADGARQTINRWVEERTANRIRSLIPEGVLDKMTRLVLVNAVYFKGDWAEPFDHDRTSPAPFFALSGGAIQVPMMSRTGDYPYAQTETASLLEMPYADDDVSMLIILPRDPHGLDRLEASLTPQQLSQWRSQLRTREVAVALPRFTLETFATLNAPLKSLGIADAFNPAAADFSGIDGQRHGLFLSTILHKAFVEVTEEGSEAAAATGGMMRVTSVAEPPPVFRADRPFVFMILDRKTGSIYFLGRLAEPSPIE